MIKAEYWDFFNQQLGSPLRFESILLRMQNLEAYHLRKTYKKLDPMWFYAILSFFLKYEWQGVFTKSFKFVPSHLMGYVFVPMLFVNISFELVVRHAYYDGSLMYILAGQLPSHVQSTLTLTKPRTQTLYLLVYSSQ